MSVCTYICCDTMAFIGECSVALICALYVVGLIVLFVILLCKIGKIQDTLKKAKMVNEWFDYSYHTKGKVIPIYSKWNDQLNIPYDCEVKKLAEQVQLLKIQLLTVVEELNKRGKKNVK